MQLRPLRRLTKLVTPADTDQPVPIPKQLELPHTSRAIHLTPAQAADWLNVTERALEAWRGNGAGPAYVELTSKTIRYRIEDLEAFVAEKLRRSTAPVYASLADRPRIIDVGSDVGGAPVR